MVTAKNEIQTNLYKTNTFGTTQKWPSWKGCHLIKNLYQATTNQIWSFLVGFNIFSAVNVLKEIKVYLNKDLQFRVFWSHSRRLKMFSVTFDFECTYIKEVQYSCSVHGFVHLFIIAISSHSHKERKEPQFFSNVTMINIKKRLWRKINELKTMIRISGDS